MEPAAVGEQHAVAGSGDAGGGLPPGSGHGRQDDHLDHPAELDSSRQALGRLLRPELPQAAGRGAREFIERYRGKFDDGYDALRDRTLARQKELGIVTADTQLAPRPAALPAWDDITDTDKMVGARWMEVFCAAIEYTDYQVGRVVEAIEESGELDNTLIIYIAGDNGPTPEGGLHGIMNKLSYWNGVPESLDDLAARMDDFGSPGTHGCYPAAWAYATATPFTYGKTVTSGGGCSTSAMHLLAGAHHGPRRHPLAVPPPDRHRTDHLGRCRGAGADTGERHRPEADGRREHALHVR